MTTTTTAAIATATTTTNLSDNSITLIRPLTASPYGEGEARS